MIILLSVCKISGSVRTWTESLQPPGGSLRSPGTTITIQLNRWAGDGAVGTKHTAITLYRFQ
jgi:hypothetical protein